MTMTKDTDRAEAIDAGADTDTDTADTTDTVDEGGEVRRPVTLPPAGVDVAALADRDLLRMAIAATPDPKWPARAIPDTGFAASVAKCNGRTLRRYLQAENPRRLTPLLREKCEDIVRAAARKAARAGR